MSKRNNRVKGQGNVYMRSDSPYPMGQSSLQPNNRPSIWSTNRA